jgi:4-hydroxy-2-oxoglutarate aldolase
MSHAFAGIYTPLVTPFTDTGSLDTRALASNVDHFVSTSLTGLVVLGSNGEAVFLDEDESDLAIGTVRERLPNGRPLIAGTGRESTRGTIAASKRAATLGADAVMVRTPSFFKAQMVTDIFVRHYTEVADASPVPVLLYNVAMFTGVNIAPEAVDALSQHPNIVGLKESGTDTVLMGDYLTRAKAGFTILAGSPMTMYASFALGAHGAVLALAGLVPELCVDLWNHVKAGRHADARDLQRQLVPLARSIGQLNGIGALKAAYDLIGLVGGVPRAPLRPVGSSVVDTLRTHLSALAVLDKQLAR